MTPPAAAPSGPWSRLDARVFAVERAVVVGAAALMTVFVFLAVVWRMFAAPVGEVESWIVSALGADTPLVHGIAQALSFAAWALLCLFAVRTAKRDWPWWRTALVGLAVAAAAVLLAKGFVWLLPEGLIFAQRLALCLMMWMVMLGSSMAAHTRQHIFVQAATKLIPERLERQHAALSLLLAAAFTAFLAVVGFDYAHENFTRWIETDMSAAIFDSAPIPYWTVTIAVPIGFGLTVARFAGQAVAIWRGRMPARPPSEADAAQSALGAEEPA